ncbi:MAG TPA: sulfatase-like hydrolase/transferase [Nocardioidaceae bacterium]|nr:sulfatase-like hydrolase/transferase [Nocardioidaceae bacterium]
MPRIAALVVGCLGVVLGLTAGPVSAPVSATDVDTRPNIMLITTDDQATTDLRFMPFTRRLLGGNGVTFDDTIAPNPLCCPARATIMTGQLSHNNGVWNNVGAHGGYQALRETGARTLPVWLQRAGYQTTFVGKFLNGYGKHDRREVPPGWDSWNGSVGPGVYDYFGTTINHDGTLVDYSGQYQATVFQDIVEQRINAGVDSGEPFFIWQSNLAPHGACWPKEHGCRWGPAMSAPRDADKRSNLSLDARRNPSFNERVVRDKPLHMRELRPWGPQRIARTTEQHRARVRSLLAVDRNVRDTVRLLEERGELDNTLIIFTSDNGFMLGQHRRTGKVLPYPSSLQIPLLMRGPGIPHGELRHQSTALVDIAPTIAAAAAAEPMLVQDGRSLLPLARGESKRGYGAVAIETGAFKRYQDGWLYQGVRTPRWTYVQYPQSREFELYDRRADPYALTNLAYRPTHRDVRAALHDKLERLRRCQGKACRTVSGAVPRPLRSRAPVHPDELGSIGDARRVVTITAGNWRTGQGTLVGWHRSGRSWRIVRGPLSVLLGQHGLVGPGVRRHESGETPVGTFQASTAFGRLPDPGAALPYRRIDRNDYWPMDRHSPRTYNVFQPRKPANARWPQDRYERLWQHRFRYPHAVVMDYNLGERVTYSPLREQRVADLPADLQQGSFILHAGDRLGEHGWVSMRPKQVIWLARWLRPGTPVVVGTPHYLRRNL